MACDCRTVEFSYRAPQAGLYSSRRGWAEAGTSWSLFLPTQGLCVQKHCCLVSAGSRLPCAQRRGCSSTQMQRTFSGKRFPGAPPPDSCYSWRHTAPFGALRMVVITL